MKKISFLISLFILSFVHLNAADSQLSYKLYGFIRNDFYYNSRLNEEGIDGIYHYFPKPVSLNPDGSDANAVPNAEMISVATRIGIDFKSIDILGARTSAKIEVDFAGTGSTYFLIRLRQAYTQLNWKKTGLLIGQTWHPFFGSVSPTCVSFNSGVPFQPFNRSPQVRFTYNPANKFTLTGAAIYQMQYMSPGPSGFSPKYLKNAIVPDLYAGVEYKGQVWTGGLGLDYKTIKPESNASLHSFSATVYGQYTGKMLQVKTKAVLGQNLGDHVMPGGYGQTADDANGNNNYTNINTLSSWFNLIYGKKWQIGIFGGYMQNLGSNKELIQDNGLYTLYGRGFYASTQEQLDRLVRVAPILLYNVSNITTGLEYNLTGARFGKVQSDGMISDPYHVFNHRIIWMVRYTF